MVLECHEDKRFILGGAWDEPLYMFLDPDAQSPFRPPAYLWISLCKSNSGHIAAESRTGTYFL